MGSWIEDDGLLALWAPRAARIISERFCLAAGESGCLEIDFGVVG